jgi:hypothetical protein
MRRLVTVLAVLAALLVVALPAQAASGHRYRLGTSVSGQERAMFGCGAAPTVVRAFLIRHHGHYSIAPVGTVKHQSRIVGVCRWAHPHFTGLVTPLPVDQWPCDWDCRATS